MLAEEIPGRDEVERDQAPCNTDVAAGVGSGVLEGFGRWEQDEVPILAKVGESGFSGGKRV